MSSYSSRRRRMSNAVGLVLVLGMLVAGLLLGTESTLILRRGEGGSVSAVNAWRFGGRVTLLSHSVANLREVKFVRDDRDERPDGSRRSITVERMMLVGEGQFAYPYHDDAGLIRGFLKSPRNQELVLTHPSDIRRKVASWALLALVILSAVGWIVKLALGRDPLRGASTVKPLPPALGGAIFFCGIALPLWFFMAGHHVFGPVATRKVRLLMDSASHDNAAGIAQAAHEGVFIDVRDGQGMTALMLAVRAGAHGAVDALLNAGANPNLRSSSEETALMMAIETNHAALAARLLDVAADIGVADGKGRTALHAAAERGDAATVRLLLKAGANVNEPDDRGWTPLIFAAASGNGDAVGGGWMPALTQVGSCRMGGRPRTSGILGAN